MEHEDIMKALEELPEDVLDRLSFAMPWQVAGDSASRDADGFPISRRAFSDLAHSAEDRENLQKECWIKFCDSPPINTSIRDTMGRLAGEGFGIFSPFRQIQEVVDETMEDPRNRLVTFFPKYVARAEIEGELFLIYTVHTNGFVEIDFADPGTVKGQGENTTGIIPHPRKPQMPLGYYFQSKNGEKFVIPSIFVAYYPDDLKPLLEKALGSDTKMLQDSRDRKAVYKEIGGFCRFVVAWDRGYVTQRNVSHLRTVLSWINHYENLKKYEIDHKKSAAAYLWIAQFEDMRSFRNWLSLTDEQRAKTGLYAKKTPGGTLVLPPGIDIECKNPNLSKISDQDTDIMELVVSGLNKTYGQVTGSSKGTFASANANKGPQSDRTSDEIAFFRTYLQFDFWRAVFFLKIKVAKFPETFEAEVVTGFKKTIQTVTKPDPFKQLHTPAAAPSASKKLALRPKSGSKPAAVNKPTAPAKPSVVDVPTITEEVEVLEPIVETVNWPPHKLLEFSFPVSEVADVESRARAYLGVKHGSVVDTLGIPMEEIARRLGFGSYRTLRLRHATEKETLPALVATVDAEAQQEKTEAEPSPAKTKPTLKKRQV